MATNSVLPVGVLSAGGTLVQSGIIKRIILTKDRESYGFISHESIVEDIYFKVGKRRLRPGDLVSFLLIQHEVNRYSARNVTRVLEKIWVPLKTETVSARVERFFPRKGYGFMVAEGINKDIFVPPKVLTSSGINPATFLDETYRVKIKHGHKGPAVTKIIV